EVAELGAGYGRLAYVVVSASPGVRYTIIDIPPALYLSQRYLTTVFPGVATFRFRAWTDYADVSEEFERARIRFVLPHQAALLPRDVVMTFHRDAVPGGVPLDLADHDAIARVVGEARPDIVVVAAADAFVERCEREPVASRAVNVEALRRIADAAPNALLVV